MKLPVDEFRDFTAISDEIYLFEPRLNGEATSDQSLDPATIMLFTWGDALPKHIVKYTDGYRALFPTSRIILIQGSFLRFLYQSTEQRMKASLPTIRAALSSSADNQEDPERILVQVMSGTGTFAFTAMLAAYNKFFAPRESDYALPHQHKPKPFPHTLLVLDSTPSSPVFSVQARRASIALARITGPYVPLPRAVTQFLWLGALWAQESLRWLFGEKNVVYFCNSTLVDPDMATTAAPRLYIYSKADDLIVWQDVEENIALAHAKGYLCSSVQFDDTPHVGHLRGHPETYWASIRDAWSSATGDSTLDAAQAF